MPSVTINIPVTIESDGSCTVPLLQVPNTHGGRDATVIIWTISGGAFQTDPPGIQLKDLLGGPPFDPPFVAGPPHGFPVQYVLLDLNNSEDTAQKFGYTVNYLFNGEPKSLDPTIDNQPPTTGDPGDQGRGKAPRKE